MDSKRWLHTVQATSASLLVAGGFLGSTTASAQGIFKTEKLVTVAEPYLQAAQLHLGTHVAAGGDKILSVGGSAVYVFGQNSAGDWTQTAKLTAYDGSVLTGPIAFDGTYALVRGYTPAQVSVVHAYMYDAGRWRALGRLSGSRGFGQAIALEGCTALISSALDPEETEFTQPDPAYVHFFDRCRTGSWTWINSIASPSSSSFQFGQSIALSGNNALVGAPDAGLVHYYVRTGDTWQLRQSFTGTIDPNSGPVADERNFGSAVAMQGDLALIRKSKEIPGWGDVMAREGIVLKFSLVNGLWTQIGQIEPSESPEYSQGWDQFGERIILTPTWALISAPGEMGTRTNNARTINGAVYVYRRNGTEFTWREKMFGGVVGRDPEVGTEIAVGGQPGSHYGKDIALIGNQLVVGWPEKRPNHAPKLKTGATAVYQLPAQ